MPDGTPLSDRARSDRARDPYGWALAQAEALGRASPVAGGIDTDELRAFLEEAAEDMLSKVTSQMVNLMAHATKAALTRNPTVVGHWRSECVEFHDQIVDGFRNSMRRRIDPDELWRRARRKVLASFADHGEPLPVLPERCPLSLDTLVDPDLDIDGLVARLRADLA